MQPIEWIFTAACLLLMLVFFGLGLQAYYCRRAAKFIGIRRIKPSLLKDLNAYNHKVGWLYMGYSLLFFAAGFLCVCGQAEIGGALGALGLFPGIVVLREGYKRILAEYRNPKA